MSPFEPESTPVDSPPPADQLPAPAFPAAGWQQPVASAWEATAPEWSQPPGYAQPAMPLPASVPVGGYSQPGYPQPGYAQPGYPQPGYPQQPGYAMYPMAGYTTMPVENPFNSRATTVLVLSIVGALGLLCCITGVCSPIALVMGYSVKKEAEAAGWPEPGNNKAGRIVGIVGTVVFVLWLGWFAFSILNP
jgi:hypothetical protein